MNGAGLPRKPPRRRRTAVTADALQVAAQGAGPAPTLVITDAASQGLVAGLSRACWSAAAVVALGAVFAASCPAGFPSNPAVAD